jgi:hypothetical protein
MCRNSRLTTFVAKGYNLSWHLNSINMDISIKSESPQIIDKWDDFLNFKKHHTSKKRARIQKVTPVFNITKYNRLKSELNKI